MHFILLILVTNQYSWCGDCRDCDGHQSRAGGEGGNLHGLQVWPVLEAEGVAQLTPGHELVQKLAGSIAAVAVQVPGNLEGRDHAKMMVRCSNHNQHQGHHNACCAAPCWLTGSVINRKA